MKVNAETSDGGESGCFCDFRTSEWGCGEPSTLAICEGSRVAQGYNHLRRLFPTPLHDRNPSTVICNPDRQLSEFQRCKPLVRLSNTDRSLDRACIMPPKRKAAQAIEAAPTYDSSMPTGLADMIRSELIDIANKRRRTAAQHTIAVEALNSKFDESPFFNKLPRELRDEVYKLLWSDSPRLQQRYGRSTYTISYYDAPQLSYREHPKVRVMMDTRRYSADVARLQIPWLLASKQMLLEGLVEFHQRSVWHYTMRNRGDTKNNELVFPLITPGLVRKLGLPAELQVRSEDSSVGICSPSPDMVGVLNSAVTSMTSQNVLQEIKLSFNAEDRSLPSGVLLFDFSKLERLAIHRGLRKFEIELRTSPSSYALWDYTGAIEPMKAELQRVGELLVPGGTTTVTSRPTGLSDHFILQTLVCQRRKSGVISDSNTI